MKTTAEVQHKLQQVRYRHLKKELEGLLDQNPGNCKHLSNLSMCRLLNEPCHKAPNKALRCGVFECLQDKDLLKQEMKDYFQTRPAAEIAARFPDVAALMWVLEESTPDAVFGDEALRSKIEDQTQVIFFLQEETLFLHREVDRLKEHLPALDDPLTKPLVGTQVTVEEESGPVDPPATLPWWRVWINRILK